MLRGASTILPIVNVQLRQKLTAVRVIAQNEEAGEPKPIEQGHVTGEGATSAQK
jgi:hypothetical protein